ncbi:DNA-binding MarR family transcriptional regulator [Friedmanniella endophytica]|uniref:DNA-binding MarR family transcriptional regulator n=2 Tax=Microlunatus kandeliicorticis TaxID=1759536 RepID=A0A7W3IQ04_9ACTN|nr:DNA-binding MarR family transcriptional regulator [Microlunatus kandeliicorticis]
MQSVGHSTALDPGTSAAVVDGLDELVRFVVRHTAAHSTMSISALSTLGSLAECGALRITELAVREGVSQPSMTTMVNRLERLGLVDRRPDPRDARGTLIEITPAGREVRRRRRAGRAAFLGTLVDRLDPDEVEQLARVAPLLARLADRDGLPDAVAAAREAGGDDPPAGSGRRLDATPLSPTRTTTEDENS